MEKTTENKKVTTKKKATPKKDPVLTKREKLVRAAHAEAIEKAKKGKKKRNLITRFTSSKPIAFVRKHWKGMAIGAGGLALSAGAYFLGRENGLGIRGGYEISEGEEVDNEEPQENTDVEPQETPEGE